LEMLLERETDPSSPIPCFCVPHGKNTNNHMCRFSHPFPTSPGWSSLQAWTWASSIFLDPPKKKIWVGKYCYRQFNCYTAWLPCSFL